jgi:hypothetical protein
MEIAPGIDAREWASLNLEDQRSSDWDRAVGILEARIDERFIDPVDHLIGVENQMPSINKRFGFVVLAIDCLLVETLGAFVDGLETTEGMSRRIFCGFLTTRAQFRADFTHDIAQQFYSEFRCGILHQAEIGGNGRVWSIGPLVRREGARIIVNRNEFHERLKKDFQSYNVELRDASNILLRRNFRKKMGFVSRT